MFGGQTVSVVLPAYNEEQNVGRAIEEFLAHPAVDEVVAVDNNSTDGTKAAIQSTRAVYALETRQGFGHALMRGMAVAKGDLVVLSEPDGTFLTSDLDKLLLYSRHFDVVFGTRTSKTCIWSGANMPWLLRMGNWFVAKFLEYLHNGPSLTDVGCTYRLLKRSVVSASLPRLTVGASHFNVEVMIHAIRTGFACVEIPMQYRPRVGTSKITGSMRRAVWVGLRMIALTLRLRFVPFPRLA